MTTPLPSGTLPGFASLRRCGAPDRTGKTETTDCRLFSIEALVGLEKVVIKPTMTSVWKMFGSRGARRTDSLRAVRGVRLIMLSGVRCPTKWQAIGMMVQIKSRVATG